ncbi:MAG: cysteine desulfurase NifS [Oscillospiraceae bacterium]|nr:cysteine desulfurase NifS [Oscillospiraceae bacterium]
MKHSYIYADNAATTAVSPKVLDAMLPYFTEQAGNPSSIYKHGRDAQKAIEISREKVAAVLGCTPTEIYFTSCGTESDNWAIRSVALRLGEKGKKHIITTAIEHHAVLHTCQYLEKQGFEVTYLPVNEDGFITAEQVSSAIRNDTALVTIMYANNEIGTIMPINKIAGICHERGVLFHTDAVQAIGNIPINVKEQGIDMLSLSGHKIHAPKGIGALYVRKGIPLPNLLFGGGQERGKRPGTENVPSIVALGEAITEACSDITGKARNVERLRNKIIDGIITIEGSRLNGSRENRLSGNANVSFLGVEGEALLLLLDLKGICASSGSACTSGSLDPSHVLLALGLPHEIAHGSLRITISEEITDDDADYIISSIRDAVGHLREMSPLWEEVVNGKEHTRKLLKFVSEIKTKS